MENDTRRLTLYLLVGLFVGFVVNFFAMDLSSYNGVIYLKTLVEGSSHNISYDEYTLMNSSLLDAALSADDASHNDDFATAAELFHKIRILCWIMTSDNSLRVRAIHVRATWGRRCNTLLFVSDNYDPAFPTAPIGSIRSGRDHLTEKTLRAFDYVYNKYLNESDWFLKADDDTYVIVENLRYLLDDFDPNAPLYMGQHFHMVVKQGYHSGGSGYVLSRGALERFGTRPKGECENGDYNEDVAMGMCMEKLNVTVGDSRDGMGRSRFHCVNPTTHINRKEENDWLRTYDKYGGRTGIESTSDYAISFHYITPEDMYAMEYYTYHLKPYGIRNNLQQLNPKSISSGRIR